MKLDRFVGFGLLIFILATFSIEYGFAQSCGFGATPLTAHASAIPGQKVVVTWNLYNMYSDRKAHIVLSYTADTDWEVTIEPDLRNVSYELPTGIVTIQENLALDPLPPVEYKPEVIPYGTSYIKHPNADLYIPAKVVTFTIQVPQDAKVGESHKFHFVAKGNCFTGTGAVIPSVELGLDVTIDVVPQEFYEREIIAKAPWYIRYAGTIIVLVLIALAAAIVVLVRRRKVK
ncbi:hypothetical protein DRN63_00290 [Nanoarchaeota archaeon]|nr:MAG: hypothetical protein DRN63_00290 [Nanoarchaeota archaeon]